MTAWSEGGAGQEALPYPYYIDIVTKRYFDGVDNKDMQKVLDCFTEDAVLTEVTSNTVHTGRDAGIKAMFTKLFADFSSIWHGNFVHTADPQSELWVLPGVRHAASFVREPDAYVEHVATFFARSLTP